MKFNQIVKSTSSYTRKYFARVFAPLFFLFILFFHLIIIHRIAVQLEYIFFTELVRKRACIYLSFLEVIVFGNLHESNAFVVFLN